MNVDKFVEHLNKEKYSVIKALKHFESNMSEATMKKIIKDNGYKYNSRNMSWDKIIHTTSHDFTSKGESSSHDFTLDEVEAIRSMIKRSDPVVGTDLVSRIEALPKDDKVRKTIVISQSVGDKLDEFCKAKRVQKSDVLALAIEDIVKRYE